MKPVVLAALVSALSLAGTAAAKLPPPSEEAKAKAAETAAKNAHNAKVAAYELCKVENQLAAEYFAAGQRAGKTMPTPQPTPACVDPGPFAYQAPHDKPKP